MNRSWFTRFLEIFGVLCRTADQLRLKHASLSDNLRLHDADMKCAKCTTFCAPFAGPRNSALDDLFEPPQTWMAQKLGRSGGMPDALDSKSAFCRFDGPPIAQTNSRQFQSDKGASRDCSEGCLSVGAGKQPVQAAHSGFEAKAVRPTVNPSSNRRISFGRMESTRLSVSSAVAAIFAIRGGATLVSAVRGNFSALRMVQSSKGSCWFSGRRALRRSD
jgi:hypothetical protein